MGKKIDGQILIDNLQPGIHLEVLGGQYRLVSGSGDPVLLTQKEASVIVERRHTIDGRLRSILGNIESGDQRLDIDRKDLIGESKAIGNSVLLDTSTLNGAEEAISTHSIEPLNFLDLSTLTTALIFFDRVYVQPGSELRIPKDLSRIIRTIDYPSGDFIQNELWARYARNANRRDARAFESAWEEFLHLGQGEVRIDLNAADEYQNSPAYWNGILAHSYTRNLFSREFDDVNMLRDDMYKFLSIQTMRALFNNEIAEMIGIPYLSSAIRTPIQNILLSQKVSTRLVIDRIIDKIPGPRVDDATDTDKPYFAEISAPFALGVVMQHMQKPGDYWKVVAEWRNKVSPLRDSLGSDLFENRGNYARYVRDNFRLNGGPAGDSMAWLDAGIAFAPVLDPIDGPFITAAYKLAQKAAGTRVIYEAYLKRLKPKLHVVVSLASEAKALQSVYERIFRVWGRRWTKSQLNELRLVAATQAPNFSKLRNLEY